MTERPRSIVDQSQSFQSDGKSLQQFNCQLSRYLLICCLGEQLQVCTPTMVQKHLKTLFHFVKYT